MSAELHTLYRLLLSPLKQAKWSQLGVLLMLPGESLKDDSKPIAIPHILFSTTEANYQREGVLTIDVIMPQGAGFSSGMAIIDALADLYTKFSVAEEAMSVCTVGKGGCTPPRQSEVYRGKTISTFSVTFKSFYKDS